MEQRLQPGLTLTITCFTPAPAEHQAALTDLRQFQEQLAAVAGEGRLAIAAEIDGGRSGALLVHLTGDRAWVSHFQSDQGEDTYAFDSSAPVGPVEGVGFLLSNGQEDTVHRRWTVGRAEALQALEHFAVSGERPPALVWDEAVEFL